MQYLIKISGLNTAGDMDSKGMSLLWKNKKPIPLANLEFSHLGRELSGILLFN